MTSTTRLEVDGKKFWEAVVEGKTVTLNFGKIGKEGKSSKFEYDTEEEAKKFAIERAEIKRSRGYKDVEVVTSNSKKEGSEGSTGESKKKRKRWLPHSSQCRPRGPRSYRSNQKAMLSKSRAYMRTAVLTRACSGTKVLVKGLPRSDLATLPQLLLLQMP